MLIVDVDLLIVDCDLSIVDSDVSIVDLDSSIVEICERKLIASLALLRSTGERSSAMVAIAS